MVACTVSKRRYSVVLVTYGEDEKLSVRALWPSSRKIIEVITRKIVPLPKLLLYMIADSVRLSTILTGSCTATAHDWWRSIAGRRLAWRQRSGAIRDLPERTTKSRWLTHTIL